MTIIDKAGLRCYLNGDNKMVKVSINEYTDVERTILEENSNDIKDIFYNSYLCPVDFSMIAKMNNLEQLNIYNKNKVLDISFVNELKNLQGLQVEKFTGSLNNEHLKGIAYKWHKKSDISQSSNIEGIVISSCSDIEPFMSQAKEIKKLQKIVFLGISTPSFPKTEMGLPVNCLEFIRCPKLEDLEELPSNFPNVIKLKFDHCKNIQDYSSLARLKNLEELLILESAPISDLSFLKEMKKLSSLRILKTKITAKNVEILDEIPAKVDLLFTGIK